MTENPKYKVSLFDKALHDRSAFSCGITKIDNWIKTSISDEIKNNRTRLWCGTDDKGTLFGAYALNSHSVQPSDAGLLARKREKNNIPVLYLACLAIDLRFQGNGLGDALMGHAITKAVELSDNIGISAIVLDVFRDQNFDRRLQFYIRKGFSSFDEGNPARMYLSIADARRNQKA